MSERPAHHGPDGRFRNPGLRGGDTPPGQGDVLKWLWERLRDGRAPDPSPGDLPRSEPEVAEPGVAAGSGEVRVTWVGHATFLIQLPGLTVLTDPVFGRRASPVSWAGPKRFSPPGLPLEALPRVDVVLLSHDHYDHLDRGTVDRLHRRCPELRWLVPLRFADWLAKRGIERVTELDWWQEEGVDGEGGGAVVRALPARHWTRRRLFDARKRLWSSWSVSAGGRSVYFGGDSAYFPGFAEIGERAGPFDVALLPIGAYEPRWFMRTSHMNPEEAVQAFRDVGAGEMVGMHWGTFRLTDEPPLEPPRRTREAWAGVGLAPERLHIPALGETLRF